MRLLRYPAISAHARRAFNPTRVHRRAFTATHNPSQARSQGQESAAGASSRTNPDANNTSQTPNQGQYAALDSPDDRQQTDPSPRPHNPHNPLRSAKDHLAPGGMSQKLIPQNPADVMVIRDVTPNVTTFSVPFSRFGSIKIGGRGTLVRLTSGALAVFSPVALTDDVRAKIAEKGGDLAYIVAPDIEHHIFLSEYKAAFPAAKLVGPDGLPQKRAKQTSDPKVNPADDFAVVFPAGDDKRATAVGQDFDADFEYEFVDAHPNKEIAFFYKPDRLLIQADLLFNLPPTEQYSRAPEGERDTQSGLANRLFGGMQTTQGDLKWVRRFQWYVMSSKDRPSFNESIRRIDAWDFDTIVPCHGDVIQGDGKERFRNVFEWHLAGQKN